ncbi:MAG: AbrB/MazE/SpoVT family DNA-binding domain-containing protein [Eubacterium sp.]|nr:AbrB/MazE/SpoVT family DNA-binding domain-containing protein [Eubacterium sp.]
MKTGIIRRIDDLGRVVIPKEIRRRLNLSEGDPMEISVEGNKVCLELYHPELTFKDELNRLCVDLRNHPIDSEKDEFIFKRLNEIIDCLEDNT